MKQILTINPDTFLWTDGRNGLLYDSGSFTPYRFRLTPQISGLCSRLMNPDSLYSVDIDMDSIDGSLRNFIGQVAEKGMGTLHDDSGQRHLISFPPLLNIQRSWERIKTRGYEAYNEILPYLTSLTFYTGGICPDTDWYRQVMYPVCSEEILTAGEILRFLADTGSPYITDIRIVLSSVRYYPDLHFLLDGLRTYGAAVTLYIRDEDTGDKEVERVLLNSGISTAVFHTIPFVDNFGFMPTVKHIFLVTSNDEYLEAEKWCKNNCVESSDIIPVFNGRNKNFFYDNVLLSEQDILNGPLEKRLVFAHMSVNTGNFGRFFIMPNGKVYANMTCDTSIGDINYPIYDLITFELEYNTAWRRTRDVLNQCKNCLYRYLCPSPSVYEEVMKLDCICTNLNEKEVIYHINR